MYGRRSSPAALFYQAFNSEQSGFGYLTIARIASFEAGEYRTPWYKT